MNKRLKKRIKEFNKIKFQDGKSENRIIIATLKPIKKDDNSLLNNRVGG